MKKLMTLMTLVGLLSIPIAAMPTNILDHDHDSQFTVSITPATFDSGGTIAFAVLPDKFAVKMMKDVTLDTGPTAIPIAFVISVVDDTGKSVPIAIALTVLQTDTSQFSSQIVAARTHNNPRAPAIADKNEPFTLEQPVAVRRV